MVIHNHSDPGLKSDFTCLSFQIEKICLKAIKLSLEIPIIPIRKYLALFNFYILMLFGGKASSASKLSVSLNERTLNQLIDTESPRFNLKESESSPVEIFYKRNMTKDNPIPQVIIVGVLRVLLTTCPNASKNSSGGIDL